MLRSLTNNSFITWCLSNPTLTKLIQLPFVLSWFGYISGFWSILMPLTLVYGFYKKEKIKKWMTSIEKKKASFFSQGIINFLQNYYVGAFKTFVTLSIIANWELSIFGMAGLYGLYRTENNEWAMSFQNYLKRFASLSKYIIPSPAEINAPFSSRFLLKLSLIAFIAFEVYSLTTLNVISYVISFGQLFLIYKGFNKIFSDLFQRLRHPIQTLIDHPGILAGASWGRQFPYLVINGRLEGTLGPAYGYAESNNLVSGFFASILTPRGLFFLGESPAAIALRRLSLGVRSIFTGILFTSHIQTQGYFSGIIGPTSAQVVTCIIFGMLVGWMVESIAKALRTEISNDAKNIQNRLPAIAHAWGQKIVNFLINFKIHLLYIVLSTPVFLNSAAGPEILALANNNVLVGAFYTALASGALIMSFYSACDLLQKIHEVITAPRLPKPQAIPVAPAVAPLKKPAAKGGHKPGAMGPPLLPAYRKGAGRGALPAAVPPITITPRVELPARPLP